MNVLYLAVLAFIIVVVWNVAGRYEWQVPANLIEKLTFWKHEEPEAEPVGTLILNIEAREFITDDMEKEIYIVRRSRKQKNECLMMNVEIKPDKELTECDEIEKAKLRLEKRFPGLTIKVSQQDAGG